MTLNQEQEELVITTQDTKHTGLLDMLIVCLKVDSDVIKLRIFDCDSEEEEPLKTDLTEKQATELYFWLQKTLSIKET